MSLLNKKELASSADVIDQHLILSAPNAIDPIIWRMALDKIGTASFETKHIKTSDKWKLTLKPKKGAAETIATFNTKDEALEALLQSSEALQNPHSTTTIQGNAPQENKSTQTATMPQKKNNKWLYLFLGFLLLIGLYTYMNTLIPNTIEDLGKNVQTSSSNNNNSNNQSGVPLSADDFLNRQ